MIGTTLSHYRVLERLGAGGMGEVYRAHDERLGRDVALKVLPADLAADEASRARLIREARMASSLSHPNVCTVFDVGEADGRLYIAMELVPGRTLADTIPPHGLPAETVVGYGIQIAAALDHAHQRSVIHRDLKTGNVVVTPDGLLKVLDFGLARHTEGNRGAPAEPSTVTVSGSLVGTAHYLAPELLRGERADERSDIWALGVVLYEMASGQAPFRGRTEFELSAAILNAPPPPLSEPVPAALRAVADRCLAKDPAQRYRKAGEVRAALEGVFAGGDANRSAVAPGRAPVAVGRQPRSRWLVPAGLAALVVVIFALDLGGVRRHLIETSRGSIRSLAVLPLENLSRDPEQEYFADGMTEELITSLANLEGVRVISRTSVMRYKNTTKGVAEIARELGVDAVVEGSAMRAGDRVRITAQLIDAAGDRHLWAKSYERDLKEVIALQAEVAAAIASEIRTALTDRGKSRTTHSRPVDPQAYENYLKGRFHWATRNIESLRKAAMYFRRAIERDPGYAAAHAGLADVYAVMSDWGAIPPTETYPTARAEVLRALELDDQLAEAHATLGLILFKFEGDFTGAETELRRAIALNPSYATAHQWYAGYLSFMGKPSEAIAEIERARELDPLAPVIRWNRSMILQSQRRYDEAAVAAKEALELDSGASVAHAQLARIHLAKKEYAQALVEFDQSDSLNIALHRDPAIRAALTRGDMRAYWGLLLRRARERSAKSYVAPTVMAALFSRLGERDSALAWLERGFNSLDPGMLPTIRGNALDSLHSDPRYSALLQKHGLHP